MDEPIAIARAALARPGALDGLVNAVATSNQLFRIPPDRVLYISPNRHTRLSFSQGRAGGLATQLQIAGFLSVVDDRERGLVMNSAETALIGNTIADHAAARLDRMTTADALLFDADTRRWGHPLNGYDPGTGTLVTGVAQSLPPHDSAYPHLRRLFSGLLTTPATQQLLQVLACLIVGRAGLPEFPLVIIDASEKNSGKTRTANALGALLGAPPALISNVDRFNQQAGHLSWAPGPNILFFDNVTKRQFRSEVLSSAVHRPHCTVEPKYQGACTIFDPVFLLTMNNARVETDLADKAIFIGLAGNPGVAAIQFDPDPQTYATTHRAALLAEVHDILLNSTALERAAFTPQTRFIDWECAARAVAARLGYQLDLAPESAGGDTRDVLACDLVRALQQHQESPGAPATAADLVSIAEQRPRRYEAIQAEIWDKPRAVAARTLLKRIARQYSKIRLTMDGQSFRIILDQTRTPATITLEAI